MLGESHHQLGLYLTDRYMAGIPRKYIRVFLLGCVQPDRNPATYLKGSVRFQWFRGHNFPNASNFMIRSAHRLEMKQEWNIWDYYTLGKLMHYIADAFTQVHNSTCKARLSQHRCYEIVLQRYFLKYLWSDPVIETVPGHTAADILRELHRQYCKQVQGVHTDSHYTVRACSCVTVHLLLSAFQSAYA